MVVLIGDKKTYKICEDSKTHILIILLVTGQQSRRYIHCFKLKHRAHRMFALIGDKEAYKICEDNKAHIS